MRKPDEGCEILRSESDRMMAHRSRSLVECVPNLHMCRICTPASTRGSGRAHTTRFILLMRILADWHGEPSAPPQRTPITPRQRFHAAGPNGVVGKTSFIKCACHICTLHTFGKRKITPTLQFIGLSVWHPDCATALRPLNTNSSTAARPSTAMRGDHEQARSRDRLRSR